VTNSEGLVPLGIFAVLGLADRPSAARAAIEQLIGGIPATSRDSFAEYLRGARMVMPFMEHTVDLVAGEFSVPGGSAIMTDGVYFWRLDTADYVAAYGVELPADFLRHVEALGHTPPDVAPEYVRRIEILLADYYREGEDADLLADVD
jgi:hypothetical protein